jgi:membrane protein required for colicin V production
MHLLDIIIIATMVFLILKGMLRGFIREMASLVGVIVGIWLASVLQPQMTDHLKPYLPSIQSLPLIGFALVFGAVLFLCNFLGWILKLFFKKTFFGWADRSLGAGLATVKGVILAYLALVMITFFLPSKTPLIAESKLSKLIIDSYQSMIRLVSPSRYENLKKKIAGKTEEVGEIVSEKIEDLTK